MYVGIQVKIRKHSYCLLYN